MKNLAPLTSPWSLFGQNNRHNHRYFSCFENMIFLCRCAKECKPVLLLVMFFLAACNVYPQAGYGQQLLWKFTTAQPIVGSPVRNGQTIYFGGLDSTFYALNLETGLLRWKVKVNGVIRSAPVVAGNAIFFYSGDGVLHCLQQNGQESWRFKTKGEGTYDPFAFADYFLSSPVYEAGTVYFCSGDSSVYAVDASNGQLRWRYKTGDVVHATPCLYNDKLYVGSFDGWFYCLAKKDGDLQWKFKSIGQEYFPKGEFNGSATAFNNTVFVGGRDYNFYALNANQPTCRWNLRFAKGWAITKPLIQDSLLYLGTSDDRKFLCLDPQSGKTVWAFDAKYNLFGAPAAADSVVYEGTMMGHLFGLHKKTGKLLFDFTTDGYRQHRSEYFKEDDTYRDDIFTARIRRNEDFLALYIAMGGIISQPIIHEGKIIFTSMDGHIYCVTR